MWGRAATLLTVLLSFVLFRADTLAGAGLLYRQMFTGFTFTLESAALLREMATPLVLATLAVCLVCALPVLPWLRQLGAGRHARAGEGAMVEAFSYLGALALLLLCMMDLAGSGFNPFIYFRF